MKKLIFTTILTTVLSLSVIGTALAQTPAATDSAELRKAIRDRIEQTLQNTDDSTSQNPYVGIIGNITQVSTVTFTMTGPNGDEHTIQIPADTPILEDTKSVALKDFVIGNGVSIIGTIQDNVVVTAKRILLSTEPFQEDRQVFIGTVTDGWNQKTLVLQLRGSDTKESDLVAKTTIYEDIQGNKLTAKDIQADQAVLMITDLDSKGARYVKRVRLLVPLTK